MRFRISLVLVAATLTLGAPAGALDQSAADRLAAEGNCIYCDLNGLSQPGLALPGTNLSGSNLSDADLAGADLSEALLSASDLTNAKLSGALLPGARLDRALLSGADLSNADLTGASLRHADLRNANLSGARLTEADLFGADLRGTDLSHTDLTKADLRWARVQDLLAPGDAAKFDGVTAAGADLRFIKGLTPEMTAHLCGDPETRHSLDKAVVWYCEPLEKAGPDAAPIEVSLPVESETPAAEAAPQPAPEADETTVEASAPAAVVPDSAAGPIDWNQAKSGATVGTTNEASVTPASAALSGAEKMDAVKVEPVEAVEIGTPQPVNFTEPTAPEPATTSSGAVEPKIVPTGDAAVAEELARQAEAAEAQKAPAREPVDPMAIAKE